MSEISEATKIVNKMTVTKSILKSIAITINIVVGICNLYRLEALVAENINIPKQYDAMPRKIDAPPLCGLKLHHNH